MWKYRKLNDGGESRVEFIKVDVPIVPITGVVNPSGFIYNLEGGEIVALRGWGPHVPLSQYVVVDSDSVEV